MIDTYKTNNKKTKNKNKLIELYFILTLFIFAFVSLPNTVGSAAEISIFYITGKKIIIHFALSIFILITLIFISSKNLKFDLIAILLLSRIGFNLIPVLYVNEAFNIWGNYLTVIISFISYFIANNYSGSIKKISKYFIYFGLAISSQVLLTASRIQYSLLDIRYKYYMRIPLAASNVIACYIAPVFFLINKSKYQKILKFLFFTFAGIALIYTKSRGAIFSLLIVSVLYLGTNFKYTKKNIVRLFIVIVLVTVVSFINLEVSSVSQYFGGYSGISYGGNSFINSLSSGRISIYLEELERGTHRPIFGNGMWYIDGTSGSHNFLIDLFVQSGFVGLFIYIFVLAYLIYTIKIKKRKRISLYGLDFAVIVFLINGLVEVSFFNYITDTIFWFFAGVITSSSKNEIEN